MTQTETHTSHDKASLSLSLSHDVLEFIICLIDIIIVSPAEHFISTKIICCIFFDILFCQWFIVFDLFKMWNYMLKVTLQHIYSVWDA